MNFSTLEVYGGEGHPLSAGGKSLLIEVRADKKTVKRTGFAVKRGILKACTYRGTSLIRNSPPPLPGPP